MNVKLEGACAIGLVSRKRLEKFRKDESGVFIILTMLFVIMTLIIIGFSVDVARHEAMRVRLAATTDRAVLAAADLTNGLDPVAVVRDYFVKAGYEPSDVTPTVTVTESDSGRKVVATAYKPVNTWFMKLVGVPTINAGALGVAEQGVSMVEVSLVLDISMSMTDPPADGTRRKIDSLKIAAADFVDTVLLGGGNTTFISVIPYGSQVMLGDNVIKHFNATSTGNNATQTSCVEFATGDFSSVEIPNSSLLQRSIVFAVGEKAGDTTQGNYWNKFNPPITSTATGSGSRNNCPAANIMRVAPYSIDADALKGIISAFNSDYDNTKGPWNYTSVDIAAKWGVAFLDPTLREEVTAMASDPLMTGNYGVPSAAAGHPFEYTYRQDDVPIEDQTMKVMVLMTDGLNTYDWSTLEQTFYKQTTQKSFVYANSDWTIVDFQVYEGTPFSTTSASTMGDGTTKNPATIGGLANQNNLADEKWYHAICTKSGEPCATAAKWTLSNRWTSAPTVAEDTNTTPDTSSLQRKTWPEVFAHYTPEYLSYLIGKMMATTTNTSTNATAGTLIPSKALMDPQVLKLYGLWPTTINSGNVGTIVQPLTGVVLRRHPTLDTETWNKLPMGFYKINAMSTKDDKLRAICAAAKVDSKKVIIYTIGYDLNAPSNANAKTQMTDCATPGKAFYPSGDNDIGNVFKQIATEIGKLRLTQ